MPMAGVAIGAKPALLAEAGALLATLVAEDSSDEILLAALLSTEETLLLMEASTELA